MNGHNPIHPKKGTSLMKTLRTAILYIMVTSAFGNASDQIPAPPQTVPVAIVGAAIHPVSGPVIEKGTILFDKGKIVDIGATVAIPSNAIRIEAAGKHVYPGLIDANARLGLVEISSVRGSTDLRETGTINPNVRPETAVNTDSERIPVARSNGVALAVITPEGGIIPGKTACIMLDGWTWEDMTFKAPVSMTVLWPGSREGRDELEQAFRDARAYKAALDAAVKDKTAAPKTNLRWEAMIPVLEGKLPLWIWVDGAKRIEEAVEWAGREKVKMAVVGGAESYLTAELLKKHDIPVIVAPVDRLPYRAESDYDEPFSLAGRLANAGVRFCIADGSDGGGERNLPYHAAHAAAFGLPKDLALRAITLSAAEIIGIADHTGSLVKGRDATLMITTGDPLEVTTTVERLYIQGRGIDLSDKQKTLYAKYREKYKALSGK